MLYSLQYGESRKPDPHATAALISLALEFPNGNHCMYTPFSYGIFFLVFVVLSSRACFGVEYGLLLPSLGEKKNIFFTMFCMLCVPICKVGNFDTHSLQRWLYWEKHLCCLLLEYHCSLYAVGNVKVNAMYISFISAASISVWEGISIAVGVLVGLSILGTVCSLCCRLLTAGKVTTVTPATAPPTTVWHFT